MIGGLLLFGVVFAINSALHSYLILAFAQVSRVTMDVGFYYMSNAAGRLLGTLLSGLSYQAGGLPLCLARPPACRRSAGSAQAGSAGRRDQEMHLHLQADCAPGAPQVLSIILETGA